MRITMILISSHLHFHLNNIHRKTNKQRAQHFLSLYPFSIISFRHERLPLRRISQHSNPSNHQLHGQSLHSHSNHLKRSTIQQESIGLGKVKIDSNNLDIPIHSHLVRWTVLLISAVFFLPLLIFL